MHHSYKVNIDEVVEMIIASKYGHTGETEVLQEDHDNGVAVQVYRACTDMLEKEVGEETIDIIEHYSAKFAWYYKIAPKLAYNINDIKDTAQFKMDNDMGLKCPCYGELVWQETKQLTPSITQGLPQIYKVAFHIRQHAHNLFKELPILRARFALESMMDELKQLE